MSNKYLLSILSNFASKVLYPEPVAIAAATRRKKGVPLEALQKRYRL